MQSFSIIQDRKVKVAKAVEVIIIGSMVRIKQFHLPK